MLNFFRCSCTNNIDIEPNAQIYIDNIHLTNVKDQVIQIGLEITVIMENIYLNQKIDSIYLSNHQNNSEFTIIAVDQNQPLTNRDNSSQHITVDLNINISPGLYKLYYLRKKYINATSKNINQGLWDVLGQSQQIKIELINQHEIKFTSPSLIEKKALRDITNHDYSEYVVSVEDENTFKRQFKNSQTPKLLK
ncbi:hypothetical protein pb186bvf_006982 [Paramecium bursaria]